MAGLFIFGYMHCGTSLLHEILVRHSSIFAKKKELKFIEYLYEIKRRFPHLSNPEQKRAYASFCASVINHSVRITKSIDEIPLGDTVVAVPSVDDHLTIFFDVFHQLSKDHKYWLDGSLNNIFYHKEIRDRLPNAKFIAIIRDVRDVLASKKKRQATTNEQRYRRQDILKQKKLEKDFAPVIDALSWKNTYTVCKYLQDYDPSTLVVRYEDLTLMPQQTIKDICLFLDIPYDDTLLSVAFSNASDVQMKRRGIYLNSGNYKKVLAPTEIAAAQTITKGLLKRYNYQLEKTPTFVAIASLKEWASLGIQLVRRLWKRFRLFNRGYFWAFLVLNFNKLRRGMLKSGLR